MLTLSVLSWSDPTRSKDDTHAACGNAAREWCASQAKTRWLRRVRVTLMYMFAGSARIASSGFSDLCRTA
jgi:hypothetical protein